MELVNAGDEIEVLEIIDADWKRGRVKGGDRSGVFPSNYVQPLLETETQVYEEPPIQTEPELSTEEPQVTEEQPTEEQLPLEEEPTLDETAYEEPAPLDTPYEEPAHEETPFEEPIPEEEPTKVSEEETVHQDLPPDEFLETTHEVSPPVEIPETEEQKPVETEEFAPSEEIEPEATAAATTEPELNVQEGLPFFAYAVYDFSGETSDDLSFSAGDMIEVIEIVDDQWWKGSLNGNNGIFPANFVSKEPLTFNDNLNEQQILEPAAVSSGLGYVVAEFDFPGESEGDLQFVKGDRIEVLEIIDENWTKGRLNGLEGIFPSSFVTQLQED